MENLTTNTTNRLSILEILNLGKESSDRIRKNSENIVGFMEKAINMSQDSLIDNMDKIIAKINFNRKEQSSYSNKKGIGKLMANISNVKERITDKYTSIVSELRKMEDTVTGWKGDFQEINNILTELKTENLLIIDELKKVVELIENELVYVKKIKTVEDSEKRNHLTNKLNGISTQILTLQHSIDNILIIQKTNYNIYSKLDTVYCITIPIIEQQLSTRLTTKHHKNVMNQTIKLEDLQNDLIKSSAKELIEAGEASIRLMGDNGTTDAIQEARSDIIDGVKMLSDLDNKKVLELEANIQKIKGMSKIIMLENQNQSMIEMNEEVCNEE